MTGFARTASLLALLSSLFMFAGYGLGGEAGMITAFLFAIIFNFGSYWYSDKIVLRMYKAQPSEDKALHKMVEELADEANLPKPKVYEVGMREPNAFATGRNPENSAVVVTQGIKEILNKDELEAVLAHEMAHIKNRDILVSTMAATLAAAITQLAFMARWAMIFGGGRRDRNENPLGMIMMLILAPIAATVIRLAISRTREFGADYTGALISHKPESLASALEKISSSAKAHPMRGGNSATAHMFIVNPFGGSALMKLFATHPPVEERTKKLRSMSREP